MTRLAKRAHPPELGRNTFISPRPTFAEPEGAHRHFSIIGLAIDTSKEGTSHMIAWLKSPFTTRWPRVRTPVPSSGARLFVVALAAMVGCRGEPDRGPLPEAAATRSEHALDVPSIDRTVVTSFYDLARDNLAAQLEHTPGFLQSSRAALVRGRVVGPGGSPLDGISVAPAIVSIRGNASAGYTTTGPGGEFALSVNAHGAMTIELVSDGLITAQRRIVPRPNEVLDLGLIKLIAADETTTAIILDGTVDEIQVHRAATVTDQRGSRQVTLLFHPQSTATLQFADETTEQVDELHVTATEFTVGDQGANAMPADIAFGTMFTYAVEFSASEIVATGAKHAYFDPPATAYMENFLDVPVGTIVPAGSYDQDEEQWVGELNGRVVQVRQLDINQPLGPDNVGLAIDRTGTPATQPQLALLGIGPAELEWLSENYPAGTKLWRTPIPHFSTWDKNFSGQPPDDAMSPMEMAVFIMTMGECTRIGSVIECENQGLGESLELADLPFGLHYRSSRTVGSPDYTLKVQVIGNEVPESLLSADVSLEVGGRVIDQAFPGPVAPNTVASMAWDGKDAHGRVLQGPQPVKVCVTFTYPSLPRTTSADPGEGEGGTSFGDWVATGALMNHTGVGVTKLRKCYGRDGVAAGGMVLGAINQGNMFRLGALQIKDAAVSLGGWSLGVHHTMDPLTGTLYLGTGETQHIESKQAMAIRVAGNGTTDGIDSEQQPAISVPMQPQAIAVGLDSSLYVATSGQVRRVLPDGSWTRVAGTGTAGFTNLAGVATAMKIGATIVSLEISASGDLFIGDYSNRVIWLLRDGTLTRLVGSPSVVGPNLDVGFATQDEEAHKIFAPNYSVDHPQYGKVIMARNAGEAYPKDVYLGCLEDLKLSLDGQRLWILQSCGQNGTKRLRQVNLTGALPWLGTGQAAPGQFYDHRARVKHISGWPYPSWMSFADRPNPEVDGQPGDHYGWATLSGDVLKGHAFFGEEWTRWFNPQSITTGDDGVYVAELGSVHGTGGSIRKFRPGSGTTTLGLSWEFLQQNGEPTCNANGCAIEITAYDGVNDQIEEVAASGDTLYYVTLANDGAGVFASTGGIMPGRRILGGGDQLLNLDQAMSPALDFDLWQARDLAVGPDGSVYVADFLGRKVVRIATVSTPGYKGGIVASRDNTEYYTFDAQGRHLSTHDAMTHVAEVTFGYDPDGYLSTITDFVGRVTTIARKPNGEPSSITTPSGRVVGLALTHGYLTSLTQPTGAEHVLEYSPEGLLVKQTSPAGLIHTYTYDEDGRLLTDTDPAGRTQTLEVIEHSGEGRVIRHTDEGGRTTEYRTEVLDTEKEVLSTQTWPDGSVSSRRTFADGHVETTGPTGIKRSLEYAPHPQLGPTASYVNRVTIEQPGVGTISAERILEIDRACTILPVAEHCTNDPNAEVQPRDLYADRVTETTILDGGPRRLIRRFTRSYQNEPAELLMVSAENRATRVRLDELGRPRRIELGVWNGASFVHGGFHDTTLEYAEDGDLAVASVGARHVGFERAFDGAGTTVTTMTAVGELSLRFDLDGWLHTVNSALGQANFGIDADGAVTGYRPEQGQWHGFDWPTDDADGAYFPANDFMIEGPELYTFNADFTLQSLTMPGEAPVTLEYDAAGRLETVARGDGDVSFTYAGNQPESITDPAGGTLVLDHDGLQQSITRSGPETQGVPKSVVWTFGNELRLASESINGAHVVAYGYNDDDQIVSAGAMTLVSHPVLATVATTTLGSVHMEASYDSYARPQSITYDAGNDSLYAQTLTYDPTGRIQTVVETIQGASKTIGYEYDASNRLLHVSVDGGTEEVLEYAGLDWSSRGRGGVLGVPTYDDKGRLATLFGTSYGYDAQGRRVSAVGPAGEITFDYDPDGMLRSVPSHEIDYVIDGLGRRVGKRVQGAVQKAWLYHNQTQIVAELDGAGDIVSRFVYATHGHVPAYMVRGAQTYQLVTDVRGSVRLVVNAATGQVAQRLDYDTWGRVVEDTNPGFQPFGFAGGLYDADTKLYHFGAREYDPQVGRFLQPDPQLFGGSDGNLHTYCGFDPVNLIDPNGERPSTAMTAWFGFVDAASFGLTGAFRSSFRGEAWEPDKCSIAYFAGQTIGGLITGGGLSWGYRAYKGVKAAKAARAATQAYFKRPLKSIRYRGRSMVVDGNTARYRSLMGTSGKNPNHWYPFYGVSEHRGFLGHKEGWVIKGHLDELLDAEIEHIPFEHLGDINDPAAVNRWLLRNGADNIIFSFFD